MQTKIESYLQSQQFHPMLFSGKVFYTKPFDNGFAVVQVYTMNTFAVMDSARLLALRSQFEQFVRTAQVIPVPFRFMTLVLVEDEVPEHFGVISDEVEGIWFISRRHQQVIVYERQSLEYFHLYEGLQDYVSGLDWKAEQSEDLLQELKQLQPITIGLVLINIIVYVMVSMGGDVMDANYMFSKGATTWTSVLVEHQFGRLFSSMFLHFGISHLANNMISLLFLGSMLEKRMGHIRFLILYVASGLLSGIASVCYNDMQATYFGNQTIVVSAGASGAIFGVIGGLLLAAFVQNITKRKLTKFSEGEEELSIRSLIWMAIFSVMAGLTSQGVDNSAHIGGLIAGFILAFLLCVRGRRKQ